jgi:hypothetical protein
MNLRRPNGREKSQKSFETLKTRHHRGKYGSKTENIGMKKYRRCVLWIKLTAINQRQSPMGMLD